MDILIADADEETRLALVEAIVFAAPTARVREASNGAELRTALTGPAPDIIFIDTILPDVDAATVMAWRGGAGARSVVVLVADLLTRRWPQVARRLDAYDVLVKPLSLRNVENVLAAAAILFRDLDLLLVEPGAKTRELARQVLDSTLFRFRVTEAVDGASALRAVRAQPFDLVIVGAAIPDMPLSEVVCRLDALESGARLIVTGGRADTLSAGQLALFGASAYLTMPFSARDLDRLVYEAFGLWQPYLLKALQAEEAGEARQPAPSQALSA